MNKEKAIELLTKIFDLELNGIIRYTHYSLMVFGPNRIPLVEFFRSMVYGVIVCYFSINFNIPRVWFYQTRDKIKYCTFTDTIWS